MSSTTRQHFAERTMVQLYRTMINLYRQMNMATRLRTQKQGKAKGKGLEEDSDDPDTRSILIPVMGLSGVGKSTFINAVLGKETMPVGHDTIDPGTVDITSVDIGDLGSLLSISDPLSRGRRVLLVDTPGFDDDPCDDAMVVLERLANWLKELAQNNVLGGVIYLHDISLDRYTGSARKNLRLFRCFYGDDALHTIVLGTTKGGRLSIKEAEKRLARLKDPHWKDMIEKGALAVSFEGNPKSALDLVRKVLRGFNTDIDPQVEVTGQDCSEPDAGYHIRVEKPSDGLVAEETVGSIARRMKSEESLPKITPTPHSQRVRVRHSFDGAEVGEQPISSGEKVQVLDADRDPVWWNVRDVRTGKKA